MDTVTRLQREKFVSVVDGKRTDLYSLKNARGMEAVLCNHGARLVQLTAPDRNGEWDDVVVGYDSLPATLTGRTEMGATIGRCVNRIAGGQFTLDGKEYRLDLNDGPNHIHGGARGAQHSVFDAVQADRQSVRFTLQFREERDGYPGNCMLKVIFTLTDDNALRIDYDAVADRAAPFNVSNHAYFNLSGTRADNILEHRLQIRARRYTLTGETLIPTGEIASVAGTPLDFTSPRVVGERIDDDHEQIRLGKGYDHNFVLDRPQDASPLLPVLAARLSDPRSGRFMETWTTEPGLQLYTGNFLNGEDIGKEGRPILHRGALCLETQHFPDAVHHLHFPDVILRPGCWFSSTTIYRFGAEAD